MTVFNNEKVEKQVLVGAAAPSFFKTIKNPYRMKASFVNSLLNSLTIDRPKTITDFAHKVFALKHSRSFLTWF